MRLGWCFWSCVAVGFLLPPSASGQVAGAPGVFVGGHSGSHPHLPVTAASLSIYGPQALPTPGTQLLVILSMTGRASEAIELAAYGYQLTGPGISGMQWVSLGSARLEPGRPFVGTAIFTPPADGAYDLRLFFQVAGQQRTVLNGGRAFVDPGPVQAWPAGGTPSYTAPTASASPPAAPVTPPSAPAPAPAPSRPVLSRSMKYAFPAINVQDVEVVLRGSWPVKLRQPVEVELSFTATAALSGTAGTYWERDKNNALMKDYQTYQSFAARPGERVTRRSTFTPQTYGSFLFRPLFKLTGGGEVVFSGYGTHANLAVLNPNPPPPPPEPPLTTALGRQLRWETMHPAHAITFDATYAIAGLSGRCNTYHLASPVSLVQDDKDNRVKGVRHSDLSDRQIAITMSEVLAKSDPPMHVFTVNANRAASSSWLRPFCWGSYRYRDKNEIRIAYPRGGCIDYEVMGREIDVTVKNNVQTVLKDSRGQAFRFLAMNHGPMPDLPTGGKAVSFGFGFKRTTGTAAPLPVAVRLQLLGGTEFQGARVLFSTVEPAIHIGQGIYLADFKVPPLPIPNRGPPSYTLYLSPVLVGPDNDMLAMTDPGEVVRYAITEEDGGYRLVLNANKWRDYQLEPLRRALNANRTFATLPAGMNNLLGLRIWVVNLDALAPNSRPPANADALLVRLRRPEELAEARAKVVVPNNWQVPVEPISKVEMVLGGYTTAGEIVGIFQKFSEAFKDTATLRAAQLLRSEPKVLKVLSAPGGKTVYQVETGWVSETQMAGGITVIERGADSMPVGSKETAFSRLANNQQALADKMQVATGTIGLGLIFYNGVNNMMSAGYDGDVFAVMIYSAEMGIKAQTQLMELFKLSDDVLKKQLAYAGVVVDYLKVLHATVKMINARDDIQRREYGQQAMGLAATAALGVVSISFPPTAVIDPTFRATVYALNRWLPGSASSKRLTAAALSDVGTAFAFMFTYLADGMTEQTAKEALLFAVDRYKESGDSRLLLLPKSKP